MTTMATEEARHTTDADLVRLLDDEVPVDDAGAAAHVKSCGACRARLESLRRRSTLLSEALATADPPMPDVARLRPPLDQLSLERVRRRRRSVWSQAWLRAAAAVLLLAGVAAATPARRWVLEQVARLRGTARETVPTTVPLPQPVPRAPAASSAVLFTPAGDELTITLVARQAAGTLELIAGQEPRSSAEVTSEPSGEAFLVLPSELRIRNSAASRASYRVVLSTALRRVRVRIGDDAARETSIELTPATRRTIDLGR